MTVETLRREERNGYVLTMKQLDLGVMNFINGYVSVPDKTPFRGMEYDDMDVRVLRVHGGLTFSAIENNLWTFGFDTAHYGDDTPEIQNEEYVWSEIESLYEQLVALNEKGK